MAGIDDIPYVPEAIIPDLIVFGTSGDDAEVRGTDIAELYDALAGDDLFVSGIGGDDVFIVGAGFDKYYGGTGQDTALFPGRLADYAGLDFSGNTVHIVDALGTAPTDTGRDRLKAIENFEFQDAIMNALTGEVTFKSGEPPPLTTDFDLSLGTIELGEFGNRFNGTQNQDGIITASFDNTGGDAVLSLTGFDIDFATEVKVSLNGEELGFLSEGPDNAFNTGDSFTIAAADQATGTNTLTFEQAVPTYVWGITDILLEATDAPPEPGLVVTTIADIVANDGEISLREAIATANALAGEDTITFADALSGKTIKVDGFIDVTDSLSIEGGGQITLTSSEAGLAFRANNDLEFSNITFANITVLDQGIVDQFISISDGAKLTLRGSEMFQIGTGNVDIADGGQLILDTTDISRTELSFYVSGSVQVRDSSFLENYSVANLLFALGPGSSILNTSFEENSAEQGAILYVHANSRLENTSIVANRLTNDAAVRLDGSDIAIVNSTIAENSSSHSRTAGIFTKSDADGGILIESSTITGNAARGSYSLAGGLYAYGNLGVEDSNLRGVEISDSIVTGNTREVADMADIAGSIRSLGNNIFGQADTSIVTADDIINVSAADIFSTVGTFVSVDNRVPFGVATENGGPTPTVALLGSLDNPARDHADRLRAPAEDQRGEIRDAAPDAGAFEFQEGEVEVTDFNLSFGLLEPSNFGNKFAGLTDADGIITASFENTGGNAILSLTGYDIDFVDEVKVSLNGDVLGFLRTGPNNGFNAGDSFTIGANAQDPGTNILTFEQNINDTYVWGITDIFLADSDEPSPRTDISDLFPLSHVTGTSGVDNLNGTDLDELVDARGGDDTQHGQGGDDFVMIGTGRDKNYGGVGFDVAVFDGVMGDFSGVGGVSDVYLIDDLNTANGDLGFDRIKAFEILAFNDALFDTRTGQSESFTDSSTLVARLEDIIASGETIT